MKFNYLIILIPILLYSQNPSRVSGRVVDMKLNEGLAGVNIIIKGTYYGAASDADGYYNIPQINSGIYDIDASIIG